MFWFHTRISVDTEISEEQPSLNQATDAMGPDGFIPCLGSYKQDL